jgi:antagonist of KipI
MLDTFYVKTPGVLTTIQDMGRVGYGQYGIAVSGAMDRFSLYAANLLVGNDPGCAGLEITLYRLKLEVLRKVRAAVTGAAMNPVLDGKPLPMWQTVELPAGSTLLFKEVGRGARCYLSVQGGLDAPLLLGSRSTHSKALLGEPLRKGDLLRALPPKAETPFLLVPNDLIPTYSDSAQIRVVMGPQEDAFTARGIDTFLSESYTITPQSDRQGYRLKGEPIEHRAAADIISDAILPGSIQVPGNGQPIIMMIDAQTTGGYAKIACVIGPDMDILGQMLPGRKVKFCKVSIEEAHSILRARSKALSEFERQLASR